jgi:hypothetical protein
MCANTHVRGVFTSDNLYDPVTLPTDMRFKFAYDLSRWHEFFHWQELPRDWNKGSPDSDDDEYNRGLDYMVDQQRPQMTKSEQRAEMRKEIDDIIMTGKVADISKSDKESPEDQRKRKYEETQRALTMQFKSGPGDAPASGFMVRDDDNL